MAYGCARCGGLRRPAALRVCACAECEDRADRQGAIRDNGIELELNLSLLEPEQTGGWVASHFDIVDKISPGEPPDAASVYTHKLNFELDTAFLPFSRLSEANWLRHLEVEGSLDYVATGLPRAGDVIGNQRYLDDASRWSFSLVGVVPLAPLAP